MTSPQTAPRVLVVEHEADDPVAWFGRWLTDAGAVLDVRPAWDGEDLPSDLRDHDALIVMGGAMGANDDAEHAWLSEVKALYRDAVARRTPTLGICLGHQLAAVALGGVVETNPGGKQVGLLPVGWSEEAVDDALVGALTTAPRRALQWNDDVVVELPDGAVLLARASTGEIQAARFAPSVWGVQWHPEADDEIVGRWIHEEGLPDGSDPAEHLAALAAARDELDDAWRPLAVRLVDLARRL